LLPHLQPIDDIRAEKHLQSVRVLAYILHGDDQGGGRSLPAVASKPLIITRSMNAYLDITRRPDK
jgi:hypothetical protein